jgi:hypothetical protein
LASTTVNVVLPVVYVKSTLADSEPLEPVKVAVSARHVPVQVSARSVAPRAKIERRFEHITENPSFKKL